GNARPNVRMRRSRRRGCEAGHEIDDTSRMSTPDTVARLLRALDDVRDAVRAQALDADRRAALSDEIVDWLVAHGLFRLWIPQSYDGLELTLPEALAIYEAAARIDGSFGWAVMIGAGGGLFAAYLEPGAAREIYGP